MLSLLISKEVLRMIRTSGLLFTALYLKECSTALMKYYASGRRVLDNNWSGPYVSLSRAGIPRIIPSHHRHILIIMSGGERGDKLVRFDLSVFSVCRIVKLARPIIRATFSSIRDPVPDIDRVKEVMGEIKSSFSPLWPPYLPHLPKIALKKGFR